MLKYCGGQYLSLSSKRSSYITGNVSTLGASDLRTWIILVQYYQNTVIVFLSIIVTVKSEYRPRLYTGGIVVPSDDNRLS